MFLKIVDKAFSPLVESFLNKLEKYTDDPEWLIYHLQSYFANFDKFERLERTYRRIKESSFDSRNYFLVVRFPGDL